MFIDYGLFQVFGYFLKSSLCYDNSKTIPKIHKILLLLLLLLLYMLSILLA